MNDECSACGRSMKLSNGSNLIGISVRLTGGSNLLPGEFAEAMSPYVPGETYNVCFPCWLKGLGVKPHIPEPKPEKKNPFVAEVVKIIRRELLKEPVEGDGRKSLHRTIVLVSDRFYRGALAENDLKNSCLSDDLKLPLKQNPLRFLNTLLLPAYWLKNYEFEVR